MEEITSTVKMSSRDKKIANDANTILAGISESEILQIVAQGIQTKSQKPLLNFGTKLQTSVGLIFRPAMNTPVEVITAMRQRLCAIRKRDENHYITERIPFSVLAEILGADAKQLRFETLIAQRPKNESGITDMYSHQVRFLGGKCEGIREDDFQAVVRSVRAESGFDLQDQRTSTVYLGSMPKNFYTGRVESRQRDKLARDVYSRAHIFIILDNAATDEFKFKQSIEVIKWVPFRQLLVLDPKTDIKERLIENPKQLAGLFPTFLQKLVENGVQQIVFFSLDVGMPRNMWGLHAAMLVYFMSIVVRGVEDGKKKDDAAKWKKFDLLETRWKNIFETFSQTFSTQDASIVGNFLIRHYFSAWKNEFHKKHKQGDGLDYTFMMLIGSTGLMFALDCYYKSINLKPKL